MARQTKRLSARQVSTLSKPGMHADGDGLYLVIEKSGAKRWSFIFQWQGKRKEMGLGKLSAVGLADAREKADEARRMVANGQNPIEERKAQQAAHANADVTFGSFADELVDSLAKGFRNAKHIAQWRMTLKVYAAPLRSMRLDQITTNDVLDVLNPIWQTKQETASRLRGRIEKVLDAAKAKGLRSGENPARWRGHLQNLLHKRKKTQVEHHAALPYVEMAKFMERLDQVNGMGAKALAFTILTVSRTNESRFADWDEIDFKRKVWTVPAAKIKAERDHRVPLTDSAMAILLEMKEAAINDYVFPGLKKGRPISEGTISKARKAAGAGHVTTHGFRSSFRDWVEEETNFPDRLAEAALAHIVGDETERAYKRGDVLEKRRKLMEAWDRYCVWRLND